jgi:hypothetical protein
MHDHEGLAVGRQTAKEIVEVLGRPDVRGGDVHFEVRGWDWLTSSPRIVNSSSLVLAAVTDGGI